MYPFVRFAKERLRYRNAPPLGLLDSHVTTLVCWPWDIDLWVEMNNGRVLTLYDLGRIPFAERIGLLPAMRRENWGIAVAGSTVRYRRRMTAFQRFDLVSRLVGWDRRFFYMEHSMWVGDECANAAVVRGAVLENRRMIATDRVLAAMGHEPSECALPRWLETWSAAEAERTWPPER